MATVTASNDKARPRGSTAPVVPPHHRREINRYKAHATQQGPAARRCVASRANGRGPSGLCGNGAEPGGNIGKAAMEQAN